MGYRQLALKCCILRGFFLIQVQMPCCGAPTSDLRGGFLQLQCLRLPPATSTWDRQSAPGSPVMQTHQDPAALPLQHIVLGDGGPTGAGHGGTEGQCAPRLERRVPRAAQAS